MEKINIVLAEDHHIVKDGIKQLFTNNNSIQLLADFDRADDVLVYLKKDLHPDVIIIDVSLPDISGIELLEIITKDYPQIKSLMLSMHIDETIIFNCLKAGAKGYLSKTTKKDEVFTAIKAVHNNKEYFNEPISKIILSSYVNKAQNLDNNIQSIEKLTKREIEILKLFTDGKSNQEIANQLFISIRTVESHKNHIMQKLQLKNPVEMVRFAIKNQLVSL